VGWPDDWDDRRQGVGCSMCAEGRPASNHDGVRFFSGEHADAYLHRRAPTVGYTIVVWRGRHVAEPTELDEAEWQAFWNDVLEVARALERHYRPAKVNYQILGNALPHLHVHVVLRHADDPAPNQPLPTSAWEKGTASPRSDDELEVVAAQLRSVMRSASEDGS
jgi:diadenosine tetraphosphate (Ap4A) HIT family hydrolase